MARSRKKKRPWYEQQVKSDQKTNLQKIFKFALFHDWELRPQWNGVWVIARRRVRLFLTYSPDGKKFDSCVLVIAGLTDDFEDYQRKINLRQMLWTIKRMGRMYMP